MLIDLSRIIEEQKPKVGEFTNQKVMLTKMFKKKFQEILKNANSDIEFFDSFSIVTTKKKLHVYIPNQWFYLAFIGAPLIKEIDEYRKLVKDRSNLDSEEFKKFIKNAKKGDLDNFIFDKIISGLSEDEYIYIKKFLTNYKWWGGAKELSRNDYYVSPVLEFLDLLNDSSSYVASIAKMLVVNNLIVHPQNSLFELVEQSDSDTDYESLFRQWIVDSENSVESSIRYTDTLNGLVKTAKSALNEEQTFSISLWKNPKQFASYYPIDSIMEIAKKVESLVKFSQNNNSSELKKIYGKYLEWVKTLPVNIIEQKQEYNQNLFKKHRQYIYFGAPGTGKSYTLNKDSQLFGDYVERVTFHPNTSYGSFVGVFKPFPKQVELRDDYGEIVLDNNGNKIYDEKITYSYVPGPLMKQLVNALLHPDIAFLLITEELNRANVAAVFGDLFQLLDRNNDNFSEYPININEDLKKYFDIVYSDPSNKLYIDNMKMILKNGLVFPSNFYIWGTMNSADQGVMPMDTAFKRRWEQKYFGLDDAWSTSDGKKRFANYKKIKYQKKMGDDFEVNEVSWNILRRIINDILSTNKNIPEDKLLGPYFISEKTLTSDSESVTDSFKSKVLMYLFDDVAKQNRSLIFKNIDRMRYSEVVKKFEDEGLELFGITDNDIAKYEADEYIDGYDE